MESRQMDTQSYSKQDDPDENVLNTINITIRKDDDMLSSPSLMTRQKTSVTHLIAAWHTTNNTILQTKLQIYSEWKRINTADDSDQKFLEYWNALGEYILVSRRSMDRHLQPSSGSFTRSSMNQSDMNGIEDTLTSFLTTKKLKKLHNRMILSIMKQCAQSYIPKNEVRKDIPTDWKVQMKAVSTEERNESSRDFTKIIEIEKREADIIRQNYGYGSSLRSEDSHYQERIYTDVVSLGDIAHEKESSTLPQPSIPFSSVRLPGSIEINTMVKQYLDKQVGGGNVSLEQDTMWIIGTAVRQFVTKLIKNTISNKSLNQSMIGTEASHPNPAKDALNVPLRKRKFIFGVDLADTLSSIKRKSVSARVGWERCMVGPERYSKGHHILKRRIVPMEISESILNTAAKRRKIRGNIDTTTSTSESSTANSDGKDCDTNDNVSEDQSIRRLSQGLGRGKDLLAMKARQSSLTSADSDRRISISSLLSSSEALQFPNELHNHPSIMADGEHSGDDVSFSSQQGIDRDTGSPTLSHTRRGRGSGLGSKNLMAMRARNSATSRPTSNSSATTPLSSRPGSGTKD